MERTIITLPSGDQVAIDTLSKPGAAFVAERAELQQRKPALNDWSEILADDVDAYDAWCREINWGDVA